MGGNRLDVPDASRDGSACTWTVRWPTRPQPSAARRVLVDEERDLAVDLRDEEAFRSLLDPAVPRVSVSPLYEPVLRRTLGFFRRYSETGGAVTD